jgi:hypothetical protein
MIEEGLADPPFFSVVPHSRPLSSSPLLPPSLLYLLLLFLLRECKFHSRSLSESLVRLHPPIAHEQSTMEPTIRHPQHRLPPQFLPPLLR